MSAISSPPARLPYCGALLSWDMQSSRPGYLPRFGRGYPLHWAGRSGPSRHTRLDRAYQTWEVRPIIRATDRHRGKPAKDHHIIGRRWLAYRNPILPTKSRQVRKSHPPVPRFEVRIRPALLYRDNQCPERRPATSLKETVEEYLIPARPFSIPVKY